MFEAVGYEVSYREGFIRAASDSRYSGTFEYIESSQLVAAINRASSSVLGLCTDAAVTCVNGDIDTKDRSGLVTGFRITVIVRKDEHLIENLNRTLKCFETSLDWQEYQKGPYVTIDRDFRTVEWEVDPPRPHLAD